LAFISYSSIAILGRGWDGLALKDGEISRIHMMKSSIFPAFPSIFKQNLFGALAVQLFVVLILPMLPHLPACPAQFNPCYQLAKEIQYKNA
jgi:hypothetical protein